MKEYYVDFGTMIVMAKDENEAYEEALRRMRTGEELPTIDIIGMNRPEEDE